MSTEEVTAKTDWSKIAMGVAVAVVFVMQQYHAMKLDEVKSTIVPRAELDNKLEFNADNRKLVFRDIDRRLDRLESLHSIVKKEK
jgi:hypothetical protein